MEEIIQIVAYNHEWPKLFEQESARLSEVMGEDCVGIYHVGSTSVKGMWGKPIIDIALAISSYPPNRETIKKFQTLEYQHMGERGVKGRHWFIKGKPRQFHLHVVPHNGAVLQQQVRLRNYLRHNSAAAREYEQIKLRATPGRVIDGKEYAQEKTKFIERVLNLSQAS